MLVVGSDFLEDIVYFVLCFSNKEFFMSENNEHNLMKEILEDYLSEQRTARRWKIFFRFIWVLIIVAVFLLVEHNRLLSGVSFLHKSNSVALIHLDGVISSKNHTYHSFHQALTNALKNKTVKGVIISANSPGGSPVSSSMIYDDIMRLRHLYPNKSIDVVVNDICTSGCYYVAAAANHIYASPASIVGSIGVISINFDLTKLMHKLGIKSNIMFAGSNKYMGLPFMKTTKYQYNIQQKMLHLIHKQFINAVKLGRGKLLKKSNSMFSGRYWIGEQASSLGLIDGYATVDSLLRKKYSHANPVDFTVHKMFFST